MDLKADKDLTVEQLNEVLRSFEDRPTNSKYPKSLQLVATRLIEYCIQHEIDRSTLATLMEETGFCSSSSVACFLRLQSGCYKPYNPSIQAATSFVLAFEQISGDRTIVKDYRTALLKDLGLLRAIDIDEGILRG